MYSIYSPLRNTLPKPTPDFKREDFLLQTNHERPPNS